MIFSKPVLSTNKKGTTLNWWEYWIGHAWMTGWQTIGDAFRIWSNLMCSNYEGYGLLKDDDLEQECVEWFWATLGEDEVYPKEFLEDLMQIADDVETGKVKTIPIDELFMKRLEDLVKDIDIDLTEELDDGTL